MKEVLVFIEGEGGGSGRARSSRDGEFRRSWQTFLAPIGEKATQNGVRLRCIAGRGREDALERFTKPLPNERDALRILIVDSERPINPEASPWQVFNRRPPGGATDKHLYLIVQCLETWLVADREGLAKHFDSRRKCFKSDAIPKWPQPEEVPKDDIFAALSRATANCDKYRHADGNLILGSLDRDKIRRLPSANRLFVELEKLIDDYARA